MNKEFEAVAKIYLPPTCKPLDMKEYTYRGCKMWIFRRMVKKWKPTIQGLHSYRKKGIPYNKIPEDQREYYTNEFWMGISDYFNKYGCEFEYSIEREIGESLDEKEAKFRLQYYIDNHYAEYISVEDIP